MNRQQRRMLARQAEVEAKYLQEIRDRQNKVNDRFISVYIVCIALALYNLYGWKGRGIQRVIGEFNRLICQVSDENLTFEQMNRELLEKTGIQFRLEDRE